MRAIWFPTSSSPDSRKSAFAVEGLNNSTFKVMNFIIFVFFFFNVYYGSGSGKIFLLFVLILLI